MRKLKVIQHNAEIPENAILLHVWHGGKNGPQKIGTSNSCQRHINTSSNKFQKGSQPNFTFIA